VIRIDTILDLRSDTVHLLVIDSFIGSETGKFMQPNPLGSWKNRKNSL